MNPKKTFDMHHIWLAPPGALIVPTLLVTCTTVPNSFNNESLIFRVITNYLVVIRTVGAFFD